MSGQSKQPAIAVFDRSATFRRGLRAVLEEAGFRVAEHDGDVVPELAGAAAVLVTIESGGDVTHIADLRAAAPTAPLIALGHSIDQSTVVNAVRAGSAAVLPWTSEPDAIVSAVHAALGGFATLPIDIAGELAARTRPSAASVLDEHEAEWLQFLASGKTVARLAEQVGYSEREMFRILAELYQRLGASNRSEALVKAAQLGMLGD